MVSPCPLPCCAPGHRPLARSAKANQSLPRAANRNLPLVNQQKLPPSACKNCSTHNRTNLHGRNYHRHPKKLRIGQHSTLDSCFLCFTQGPKRLRLKDTGTLLLHTFPGPAYLPIDHYCGEKYTIASWAYPIGIFL